MSPQADYVVSNGTGAAVRSDINGQLSAIVSQNSGATAPATTYAYMTWADTTAGVMKMRNGANNAWITLYQLDGEWSTIAFENGSAAAPSIYFKDSGTDTGIYSPGADQVAVSTGGTGRLFVSSAGLVGIGTSSPSTTLAVAGGISGTAGANISGSGWGVLPYVANSLVIDNNAGETRFFATGANATTKGSFIFYNGETDGGTTAAMVIDTSSRVGIGTTGPAAALHVVAGGTAAYFISNASSAGVSIGSDTNLAKIGSNGSTCNLAFNIDGAEKARIDTSGRFLVGTSTARSNFFNSTISAALQLEGTNDARRMSIVGNDAQPIVTLARERSGSVGGNTVVQNGDVLGLVSFQGSDGTEFVSGAEIYAEVDGTPGANDMPGRLVFSTTADGAASPTERMRIANNGSFSFFDSSGNGVLSRSSAGATTSENTFAGFHSATSTANGTASFVVRNNGNVLNTNNSYGSLSDIKLKENIVDANSQWSDLKALQVRNYKLKESQTHTQIGLIAQEVELVSPGLVSESPDRDENGNDLGTVTKSVNYSVLYMKAVKALQEAMERIEVLEAKVAALEGA